MTARTPHSMMPTSGIQNWWSSRNDDHQSRMEKALVKRLETMAWRPVTLARFSIQQHSGEEAEAKCA
ncbi:hypothetical protein [Rhizobium leucaenae]|uniref:hypothetical protein n=1 Tax=Rhizobium leucaenae TaxID=29450 RepID=UPI0004914B93|nr:hypothetical protein [Rhizobium leucaenae]